MGNKSINESLEKNNNDLIKENNKLKEKYSELLYKYTTQKLENTCNRILLDVYSNNFTDMITPAQVNDTLVLLANALDSAGIYLCSELKDEYMITNSSNLDRILNNTLKNVNDEVILKIFNESHVKKENAKTTTKYLYSDSLRDYGIEKITYLPVGSKNKKRFLMVINSTIEDERIEALYSRLSDIFSKLFLKMEEHEALIEQSITDSMTGLNNTNAFRALIEEIDNTNREPFTFIIGDLYRLKYVNDTYNHLYGDFYIQYAARKLNQVFKDDGLLYRTGGDEFAIFLNTDNEDFVKQKIDELHELFNIDMLPGPDNKPIDANISFGYGVHKGGMVNYQEFKTEAEEMLKENKKLLYQEKGIERRR